MIKTVIVGAAGRMGKRLVALTLADPELELVGAIDTLPELIGTDAGTAAGEPACGVLISDSFADVAGEADVVVEFSSPAAAVTVAKTAIANNCAVVSGTTGLSDEQRGVLTELAQDGRIVWARNMSLGVNTLFHIAGQVAKLLGPEYNIEIVEMHHNQKKDAPSGTAERLGEICAEARGLSYRTDTRHGREGLVGARPQAEIGMHALRGGDVVGEHRVILAGPGESLELTHRALSRDTFASGALTAAKFIVEQRSGLFDMEQILGLRPA